MSEPAFVPIPTTGSLDTTNPASNLPAGTLVEAVDCAHRHIGPRNGRSRSETARGVSSVVRSTYELDGADDYWLHRYNAGQMTLGLSWTLDVVFEPTVVGSTSGTIISLGNSTHTDIHLRLLGSGSGADERKIRCTVQASDAAGASGSAVTVTDGTVRTLAAAGTPLVNPVLVYWVRVVRSAAALSLRVNGTETTGTGLSTSFGHQYAHDGMYVGAHSTLANNYLGGWVYKYVLRTGVFNDLRDGWMDCCHSRTPSVLLCGLGGIPSLWAGSSSGTAQEISRFRNYGSVVGSPASDDITVFPFLSPPTAMGSYTDRYGIIRNIMVVRGTAYHERVT